MENSISYLSAERAKFHKKCFNCEHIKPGDNSTCKQMVWCDQPTQVKKNMRSILKKSTFIDV